MTAWTVWQVMGPRGACVRERAESTVASEHWEELGPDMALTGVLAPGSAGACTWLCCCFSSSICCRVKKGRRRQGGSSGCFCAHSSKESAWRHCTCRRKFFLCLVVK